MKYSSVLLIAVIGIVNAINLPIIPDISAHLPTYSDIDEHFQPEQKVKSSDEHKNVAVNIHMNGGDQSNSPYTAGKSGQATNSVVVNINLGNTRSESSSESSSEEDYDIPEHTESTGETNGRPELFPFPSLPSEPSTGEEPNAPPAEPSGGNWPFPSEPSTREEPNAPPAEPSGGNWPFPSEPSTREPNAPPPSRGNWPSNWRDEIYN